MIGRMISFAALLTVCCTSGSAIAENPLRADQSQVLVWRGCSVAKVAFMERCAAAYEQETGIQVRLSGGGATLGIEAAGSGGADLGGTCRACLKRLNEDLLGVKLAIVAWDALVVVVHPDNPVENITREQLRQVLQQKITNWQALGGRDEKIVVVARREKTAGVDYSMCVMILGDPDFTFGRTAVLLSSTGPVEELVAEQPRAIAVTGVSSAQKRKLKILAIDGYKPTPENIADGTYPYFRPLYLAYKPENAKAKQFVDWMISDRGQQIVAAEGTVTLAQGAGLAARYRYYEDVRQITNYATLIDKAPRGP